MQSNQTRSQALNEALKRPNGARFYCCALQVNPFAYHGRHGKQTAFQNEADYNHALVEACLANHIEAIAVTALPREGVVGLDSPRTRTRHICFWRV